MDNPFLKTLSYVCFFQPKFLAVQSNTDPESAYLWLTSPSTHEHAAVK